MPKPQVYIRLWRNKFLTTDAASLDDMVEQLEAAAAELRDIRDTGAVVLRPDGVGDDYAWLETTNPAVADRWGFVPEEEFGDDDLDEDDPDFDPAADDELDDTSDDFFND